MKLVMFDVDGTLTDTCASDGNEFVQAVHDVLGVTAVNTDWESYGQITSEGVLDEITRTKLGRAVTKGESRAVQRRLVGLLQAVSIVEIPGAREFVRRLLDLGLAVALASGDWELSARHKLAAAAIPAGDLPAAFCDSARARTDIMRHSLRRSLRHYRCDGFEEIVYIGDGSWDVRAARELGWGFVGIASGTKAPRLRALGARHVFPDYLKPETILPVLAAASLPA